MRRAAPIPRGRRVLVDTSAFFAVAYRDDAHHSDATSIEAQLQRARQTLVTTDLIVAETHALFIARVHRHAAQRWLEDLRTSIVFTGSEEYDAGRALLRRYSDKDFTLTDAISFVVMEALGIREAFTFDDHFRQYGLEVLAP